MWTSQLVSSIPRARSSLSAGQAWRPSLQHHPIVDDLCRAFYHATLSNAGAPAVAEDDTEATFTPPSLEKPLPPPLPPRRPPASSAPPSSLPPPPVPFKRKPLLPHQRRHLMRKTQKEEQHRQLLSVWTERLTSPPLSSTSSSASAAISGETTLEALVPKGHKKLRIQAYLSQLASFGSAAAFEQAFALLHRENVSLDARKGNQALATFIQRTKDTATLEACLLHLPAEQRRYGYTMLMQTFLNDHNVDAVLSLQDRITQMTPAIVPDLAMYGCIIKAYTLAGRYEEAWETWTYVRSHVSRPDSYLYSVMFGLCERQKNFEAGNNLFHLMETQQPPIVPHAAHFNAMISLSLQSPPAGVSSDESVQMALKWLQKAIALGIPPSQETFVRILQGCARHGRLDLARKNLIAVLRLGERHQRSGRFKIDDRIATAMLYAYSSADLGHAGVLQCAGESKVLDVLGAPLPEEDYLVTKEIKRALAWFETEVLALVRTITKQPLDSTTEPLRADALPLRVRLALMTFYTSQSTAHAGFHAKAKALMPSAERDRSPFFYAALLQSAYATKRKTDLRTLWAEYEVSFIEAPSSKLSLTKEDCKCWRSAILGFATMGEMEKALDLLRRFKKIQGSAFRERDWCSLYNLILIAQNAEQLALLRKILPNFFRKRTHLLS